MAEVALMRAPTEPSTRARYRWEAPAVRAWSTAAVSTSPAGPGTASWMARTMASPTSLLPSAAANPTTAMVPWTSTRLVMKASERAWLKPSASRMRS